MGRQDYGMAFILQYENVAWYQGGVVKILDRRVYPTSVEFVTCHTHEAVACAIADMVTQSAGPYTAAGMGMALAAHECRRMTEKERWAYLERAAHTLSHARPTTASRMVKVTDGCLKAAKKASEQGEDLVEAIFNCTLDSLNRRYATMDIVADHLVRMFPDKGRIMTQCYGETIVGTMLRKAKEEGKALKLFVPETRPYFQGSRLTASVAQGMGFDTTVITDNMAAHTMLNNNIDVYTSAADVICLDGYIVNKIGTYQLAIIAKYHGIPYFVTGFPDPEHPTIDTVVMEERNPQLVLEARGIQNTLEGVKGYYPSFDVTPPHLVSGVVTERGIYSTYDLKRYIDEGIKAYY